MLNMGPRQQLVLAFSTLAVLSSITAAKEVYVGQLQVVAVHVKEGGSRNHSDHEGSHAQLYHLMLKSGQLMLLKFPKPPAQMPRSGTKLMVRALPLDKCGSAATPDNGIICVGSLMTPEAAPPDVFSADQPRGPVQLKALVMQLQVCGQGPATTPEKLLAALFDGPGSQAETVEGMFKTCSYSNAEFSRNLGSQVVTATIPIPCSGRTLWGSTYDSRTCPFTEWSDVANQYVKDVLGYNWEDFKYKIYVVPPGDLCSWGGMGWVGCRVDCRAWISGDLWQYPTTWLHELGHNLYLNHAGSYQPVSGGSMQYVAYKDDSGTMGHCCSTRCFNAPHSFQLGWSKPIDVLHKDNLPAGEWRSYNLPPRVGSKGRDKNMLRIRGDWSSPAAGYNLFVEYRMGESYDSGLYSTVRDKVVMYSTPIHDAMPYTTFEGALGANQMMRESRLGSNLALWAGSTTQDGIDVHVCRPESEREEDCDDGKDNDCDGFTDMEDPDCHAQPARKMLQRRQQQQQQQAAAAAPARQSSQNASASGMAAE